MLPSHTPTSAQLLPDTWCALWEVHTHACMPFRYWTVKWEPILKGGNTSRILDQFKARCLKHWKTVEKTEQLRSILDMQIQFKHLELTTKPQYIFIFKPFVYYVYYYVYYLTCKGWQLVTTGFTNWTRAQLKLKQWTEVNNELNKRRQKEDTRYSNTDCFFLFPEFSHLWAASNF